MFESKYKLIHSQKYYSDSTGDPDIPPSKGQ